MPEGALVHLIDDATFDQYRSTLSGVTSKNIDTVEAKLTELGIDGRGSLLANKGKASKPREGAKPNQNSTIEQLSSLIQALEKLAGTPEQPQADFLANAAAPEADHLVDTPVPPMPTWATALARNMQGHFKFNKN